MTMIDTETLRAPLQAYKDAHALHERALEQISWLTDQNALEHRFDAALTMRDETYEMLTLAALDLSRAVAEQAAD